MRVCMVIKLIKKVLFFLVLLLIPISCTTGKRFCGVWTSINNGSNCDIRIEIFSDDKVTVSFLPHKFDISTKNEIEQAILPETKQGYLNRDKWEIIINSSQEKSVIRIAFCNKKAMSIIFEDGSGCDFIKDD